MNTVFLAVDGIVFVCYAVWLCCLMASPGARAMVRALWARVSLPREKERHTSVSIHDVVKRMRVRAAQHFANPSVHILAVFTVLSHVYSFPVVLASVPLLLSLVVILCPARITMRVVDVLCVLSNSIFIAAGFLLGTESRLAWASSMTLGRVLFGLAASSSRISCTCNVFVLIANCVAWHESADSDHTPSTAKSFLIGQEVIQSLIIMIFLFCFDNGIWEVCRLTLAHREASSQSVAALRLLSAHCEVVISLDTKLRISEGADKLGNFLRRTQSSRAFQGENFLSLMTVDDQARFCKFLDWRDSCDSSISVSSLNPAPAQALNVHLRTSSDSQGIDIQLFHSKYLDISDQTSHLIGISEMNSDDRPPGVRIMTQSASSDISSVRSIGPSSLGEVEESSQHSGDCTPTPDARAHSHSPRAARAHSPTLIGRAISVESTRSSGPRGIFRSPARPKDALGASSDSEERSAPLGAQVQPPPPETRITFQTLRFRISQRENRSSIIDANLAERESLQLWVAEWASTLAWIQDFANAALRPINASSWPAKAPPWRLDMNVSFRAVCTLPKDILDQPTVSSSGGQSSTHGPAMVGAASGPPRRMLLGKLRLDQHQRQQRRSMSNSQESLRRRVPSEPSIKEMEWDSEASHESPVHAPGSGTVVAV